MECRRRVGTKTFGKSRKSSPLITDFQYHKYNEYDPSHIPLRTGDMERGGALASLQSMSSSSSVGSSS